MKANWWGWANPKPTPRPISTRVDYAPHIRGRVRHIGRGRYAMEVRANDLLIARDSPFPTIAHAIAEAERVTAAARVSWMYGFGKKGLIQ